MDIKQVLSKLNIEVVSAQPFQGLVKDAAKVEKEKALPQADVKSTKRTLAKERRGFLITPLAAFKTRETTTQLPAEGKNESIALPSVNRRGFLGTSMGILSMLAGGNPISTLTGGTELLSTTINITPDTIAEHIINNTLSASSRGTLLSFGFVSPITNGLLDFVTETISQLPRLEEVAQGRQSLSGQHTIDSALAFLNNEDHEGASALFHDPKSIEHLMSCPYCRASILQLGQVAVQEVNPITELGKAFGGIHSDLRTNFSRAKILDGIDTDIHSISSQSKDLLPWEKSRLLWLQKMRQEISSKSDVELIGLARNKISGVLKDVSSLGIKLMGKLASVKGKLPGLLSGVRSAISNSQSSIIDQVLRNLTVEEDAQRTETSALENKSFQLTNLIELVNNSPTASQYCNSKDFTALISNTLDGIRTESFLSLIGINQSDKVIYSGGNNLLVIASQGREGGDKILRFYSPPPLGLVNACFLTLNVDSQGKVLKIDNNFVQAEMNSSLDPDKASSRKLGDVLSEIADADLSNLSEEERKTIEEFLTTYSTRAKKRVAEILSLHRESDFINEVYTGLRFDDVSAAEKEALNERLSNEDERNFLRKVAKQTKETLKEKPRRIESIIGKRIGVSSGSYAVATQEADDPNPVRYVVSPKLSDNVLVTFYHKPTKTVAMLDCDENTKEKIEKIVSSFNCPKEEIEIRIFGASGNVNKEALKIWLLLKKLGFKRENLVEVDETISKLPDVEAKNLLRKQRLEVTNVLLYLKNGAISVSLSKQSDHELFSKTPNHSSPLKLSP